jgi:hypothetical protein
MATLSALITGLDHTLKFIPLEDAQFAVDLHRNPGAGLASQLPCSLACVNQGRGGVLQITILSLRGESCCLVRPPSLSSCGVGPPLSILCHALTNGWYRVPKL